MTDQRINLGTSYLDVTSMMEPIADQSDHVLNIFEEGRLLETVTNELPAPSIVENILEIYALFDDNIFEPHPMEQEPEVRARTAFPILLDRLTSSSLKINSLHDLSSIYKWVFKPLLTNKEEIWGEQEDRRIGEQLLALFEVEENKKTLAMHLSDPQESYHDEAIEIAVTIYNKDEFELRFIAIKARPEFFLRKYDYDLCQNKTQAEHVYAWAQTYFEDVDFGLTEAVQNPLVEEQHKVFATLLSIFENHIGMGKEFVCYGLACNNTYTRFRAICVLARWPVNQWPKNSHDLLSVYANDQKGYFKEKSLSAAMEKWHAYKSVKNTLKRIFYKVKR